MEKEEIKSSVSFSPNSFCGKNIIITGGGSGIGLCTAKQLAQLGAKVFLFGRNINRLKQAVEEIKQFGGAADYVNVDVSLEDKVTKAVSEVVSRCGTIHGLVNNAGGQFPGPLSQITQRGFEAVLKINLVGTFLVSREVFNQSMSKSGGSIVNMISNMWQGLPSMGHSGASREGAFNLTKTAAVEWAKNGVRVNAVAPGIISSSGMETYDAKFVDFVKPIVNKFPIARAGTVEEVSAPIIFLLSDLASYITGVAITIDGGALLNQFFWPFPESDIHFHIPEEYVRKMEKK